MANFVAAYASRDLGAYAETLHPDFVYVMHPEAVAKGAPETWGREDELACAANMFSGEDRVKNGRRIPAITRIVLVRCLGRGEWERSPLSTPGCEVLHRSYDVDVRFERGEATTLYVRGICDFDVTADNAEGQEADAAARYRIIRWVDRTGTS
jgi:hypothetical protein